MGELASGRALKECKNLCEASHLLSSSPPKRPGMESKALGIACTFSIQSACHATILVRKAATRPPELCGQSCEEAVCGPPLGLGTSPSRPSCCISKRAAMMIQSQSTAKIWSNKTPTLEHNLHKELQNFRCQSQSIELFSLILLARAGEHAISAVFQARPGDSYM